MPTCTKCLIEKPLSSFYETQVEPYHTLRCKKCRKYDSPEVRKKYKAPYKNGKVRYRKYVTGVCAVCEYTHEDKTMFDIHHLNGASKGHARKNLITLCPTCHRAWHKGYVP